jgi:hypothetical protein
VAAPVGVADADAEPLGAAKPEFAAVLVRVPVEVEEEAAAAVVLVLPEAAVEEDCGYLITHDELDTIRFFLVGSTRDI